MKNLLVRTNFYWSCARGPVLIMTTVSLPSIRSVPMTTNILIFVFGEVDSDLWHVCAFSWLTGFLHQ
jgi:hypothetical protein